MFSFLKFPSKVGHWPKWSTQNYYPSLPPWFGDLGIWGSKTGKPYFISFFKNLRSFQLSGHQDPMIPLPLWAASILGDLQGVRQHLDIYGLGWHKIIIFIIIIFHRQKVREALDSGQPVNSRSPGGVTGLMCYFYDFEERKNIFPGFFYRYAASGGHNAILHLLLLQPGIDINTPDQYVDL